MTYTLKEKREPKLGDKGREYVARVFECGATGLFVKTYTIELEARFGRVSYKITGSLCDADGKVKRNARGDPLVHLRPHNFSRATDEELPPAAMLEKFAADFLAAQHYVVAQVERAALLLEARAAL